MPKNQPSRDISRPESNYNDQNNYNNNRDEQNYK